MMKKYKLLLFDVDGTLLDFKKAEKIGMKQTLKHFGLRSDDEVVSTYSMISTCCWEKLERGEITKEKLLIQRHRELFDRFGFSSDVHAFREYYEDFLARSSYLVDYAIEILKYIKAKYSCKMAIITNGVYKIQKNRIALSGLGKYFDSVYISEKVGFNKPHRGIFEHIFNDIGREVEKVDVLIIGDSLSADIKGGSDFGIDTCWFNPNQCENNIGVKVSYEIQCLKQLKDILE